LSPGFFSHLVIVPSTMDSPIWGMMMSVGIISFHVALRFTTEGRMQPDIIAVAGVALPGSGPLDLSHHESSAR
jgi:hypothetical protein